EQDRLRRHLGEVEVAVGDHGFAHVRKVEIARIAVVPPWSDFGALPCGSRHPAGSTRAGSNAKTMAAARSRRSSLVKMWPMWLLTVPSLMYSESAISLFVAPRPMSRSTSISRPV